MVHNEKLLNKMLEHCEKIFELHGKMTMVSYSYDSKASFIVDRTIALRERIKEVRDTEVMLTYCRNPTPGEIKFGEGATHYKDFPVNVAVKKNGQIKKTIKCPYDGLIYKRNL